MNIYYGKIFNDKFLEYELTEQDEFELETLATHKSLGLRKIIKTKYKI